MKSLRILLASGACIFSTALAQAQQYIPVMNGVGTNTTVIGTFSALNVSWDNEPGIQIGEWPGTSAHFLIGGTDNSFGSDNGNNDLGQGQVGGNYNMITDAPGGHQVANYLFGGMSNVINAPYNYGWSTNTMIVNGSGNYLKVASSGHDNAIAFSDSSTVNAQGLDSLMNIIGGQASVISVGTTGSYANDMILNAENGEITNAAYSIAIGKDPIIRNNQVFLYSDGSIWSSNIIGSNWVISAMASVTNNETIFIQENGFCINTNFAGGYALNVNGGINASSFTGNGYNLYDLNAANIIGALPVGLLPNGVVLTNDPSVTLNDLSLSGPLEMGTPVITSGGIPVFAADNNENVFVGPFSGYDTIGGTNNTAVGYASFYENTFGSYNTVLGSSALANIAFGWNNIAIGYQAGANYTNGEYNNIVIGNAGVTGEGGIIRIGDPAVQSATYLAGNVYASGAVFSNGVDVVSDRNAKENFATVDAQGILKKVASLPLSEWNYRTSKNIEHIGPMAQDFHAAFGLNGNDDKHISVVDEGGVALAAIQGLNQELQQKDAEIHQLQESLAQLNARVAELGKAKSNQ